MAPKGISVTCVLFGLILVQAVLGDWECPDQYMPYTDRYVRHDKTCYQYVSSEKYWTSARDYCVRYGGHLVTIENSDVNDFVIDTLKSLRQWKNNGVWIGLHDRGREMSWKWTQGHASDIELGSWDNWDSSHPGAFLHGMRDCVRMVRDEEWTWHETPCTMLQWKYRFICQYDAREVVVENSAQAGGQNGERPEETTPKPTTTTTTITTTTTTKPPIPATDSVFMELKTSTDWARTFVNRGDRRGHLSDEDRDSPKVGARVSDHSNGVTTGVVGALVGLIALVVLIIILLVVRRRRQKKVPENYENPSYTPEKEKQLDEPVSPVSVGNEYVLQGSYVVNPPPIYEECKGSPPYDIPKVRGQVENIDNDVIEAEKHKMVASRPTGALHYLPMNGNMAPPPSCDTVVSSGDLVHTYGNAPVDSGGYSLPTIPPATSSQPPLPNLPEENPPPPPYNTPEPDYAEIPDLYTENTYATIAEVKKETDA